MANTSDFIPIATGVGANTESAAALAADPVSQQGFQNGIVYPAPFNTVLRQSSSIAAMIASFTATYGPGNVLDNGNIAALEGQFVAALTAYMASQASGVYLPIAGGTMTGPLIAPAGFNSGYLAIVSSTTLTAAQSGKHIEVSGSSTPTVTLPTPVGNAGVYYNGVVASSLSSFATPVGNIVLKGTNFTSIALPQWTTFHFFSDGSNWYAYLETTGKGSPYAIDTGSSANSIVVSTPDILALTSGQPIYIKKSATGITGAATITDNAFASAPIVWSDGTPLSSGQWSANTIGLVVYDAAVPQFSLLSVMGPTCFRPANQGVNGQSFTAHGTFNFTAPVTGWYYIDLVGAGGGGGGTISSTLASGGGGGSGGRSNRWLFLLAGTIVTVQVGQGGAGGPAANPSSAGNGGTTSFGAYLQATGGGGGENSSASCAGGSPGLGSGGNNNFYGAFGGDGNPTGISAQGGNGAASAFGGGGRTAIASGSGSVMNGLAPGSGGGGAWDASSTTGGIGADGAVYISY